MSTVLGSHGLVLYVLGGCTHEDVEGGHCYMSAEALLMKLERRVLVRSLRGGLVSPRGCSLFSELRGPP